MTAPNETVILSPGLDQSKAIAELLRSSNPAMRLKGALMPGEARPLFRYPFDAIHPLTQDATGDFSHMIPTGARSTAMLLERGDIRLGEVTMSRDALRFYDKQWSIDAALAAGVQVPKTWYSVDAIGAFPIFFKSATEGGGRRGIARQPADLPTHTDDLIFQEYIDSPGTYAVGIAAVEGRVLAAHAHHEIESYPASGGSAVVVEQCDDARLLDQARRLIRHTGFSGWGLVEFKYCPRRDDYVFMEVNAKFWASSEFAFRNQPLLPKLLFGVSPAAEPCRRMVFMHRAFQRGPGFLMKLPGIVQGGNIRFTPGAWQRPAAQLFLSRRAVNLLRSLRNR